MQTPNQQVILVTGASSGMGKAFAKQLLADGHKVYVAARRIEKMKGLEERGATAMQMDVTKDEDVTRVVNAIIDKEGRIDVLINNAGYAIYGAVEDTTMEDARRQFDVNIFGLANITRKVLPHMRKQQSGKIINISSMGGKMYTPLGAWYHATKHALEGWSDCLRLEVAQFGIKVVVVEPGIIKTEFADVMAAPMMKRTGNSAYSKLAESVESGTKKYYEKASMHTTPEVVAGVISNIVRSKNPKTRYVKGAMAKPMIFMRKWLGDRLFDRIVMSQV
jgi:short-subunit dehydrogenase